MLLEDDSQSQRTQCRSRANLQLSDDEENDDDDKNDESQQHSDILQSCRHSIAPFIHFHAPSHLCCSHAMRVRHSQSYLADDLPCS